ncbi:MAG: outer membrane beta-barrel protein [Gemmatimonas sp.]
MKIFQLKRVFLQRARACLVGAVVVASAQPLAAQVQLEPSKWEVGLTPTVQVISRQLAGDVVWAGGLTGSVAYRLNKVVAVSGSVMPGFAPQLNYKDSSPLNSLVASANLEFHRPSMRQFDPYVSAGVGRASFHYENPPVGLEKDRAYSMGHGAIGLRYALTNRFNFRAEVGRQFSKFGGSPTFMSGLTLRIHDKKGTH